MSAVAESGGKSDKRICIVTAGHLSTCPRMLKAADALAEAGYDVTVVSTSWVDWAKVTDARVMTLRQGRWAWKAVRWDRGAPLRARWSAIRHRFARQLVTKVASQHLPLSLLATAHVRISSELADAARNVECDFFYGGGGALAATAIAAARNNVPFALDLEDFHSGEYDDSTAGQTSREAVLEIERRLLGRAAFLTAGSRAISDAYREKRGVNPIVVNNTFPLPDHSPEFKTYSSSGLRLYWFGQTIGAGRGLEEVVRALGLGRIPAELHLRGQPARGYLGSLRELAATVAPQAKIVVYAPAPPDEMVRLAGQYEVGLAVEETAVLNRKICLTNKAFIYILAGLAVVFTDTVGQHQLAMDLGPGALLYTPGDVVALAKGLRVWADDKAVLMQARRAAWEAAQRRWHWEHKCERGALLEAVQNVLSRS